MKKQELLPLGPVDYFAANVRIFTLPGRSDGESLVELKILIIEAYRLPTSGAS